MTQTFPTTQAFALSAEHRLIVLAALRVAGDKFKADARHWLAAETRALADRIEAAEYVKLGREVTE